MLQERALRSLILAAPPLMLRSVSRVQRDDHGLEIGRIGCRVAHTLEGLGARAAGVVEGAVAALKRRDLDELDVPSGCLVADEDDVDVVVPVLLVAVVVVDPSSGSSA